MFEREKKHIFGSGQGRTASAQPSCTHWAFLLPEAAEGLLAEAEQRAFDQHIAQCAACAEELAEARRGAAWLDLLKGHTPEPPPALLGNILAQTTGAALPLAAPAIPAAALPASYWVASHPPSLPLRGVALWQARIAGWLGFDETFSPMMQPRLAMTGAMAFFSLCLTLNLLGFSVPNARAEITHPAASLQRTAAGTGASLVRSLESIRVVYRLEARVNEWRTAPANNEGAFPVLP